MAKLLDNIAVDTDGVGIKTDGGSKTVAIWGTDFGGGIVTLEASPEGTGIWITLTIAGVPAQYTADAIAVIDFLGNGMLVRATLSGATSPVGVNAAIYGA